MLIVPRKYRGILLLALAGLLLTATPAWAVRVARVRSWVPVVGDLPIIEELNTNWSAYGPIRVEVDVSLSAVSGFTYEDLAATDADVIWLSNCAGGGNEFSLAEIAAIERYAEEGHPILGTYKVFRSVTNQTSDNRKLAPLLGLPEILYWGGTLEAEQSFEIIDESHPLFRDVSIPYVSDGFTQAQAPQDLLWDPIDLVSVDLLGQTADQRGVITFYETAKYYAVYISKFVDYFGNRDDTQFIYNALTLGAAPTGACCAIDGNCDLIPFNECTSGLWDEFGGCEPNLCLQPGACCGDSGECESTFEENCPFDNWKEGINCEDDLDQDQVADGCDLCLGFDDSLDDDDDGVPDGCDDCPGFDNNVDADGDGVPDGCDTCPGFDDLADEDQDGAPDACDICPGFDDTRDCDQDGTPDGCETGPDCNNNTIPDSCDVESQASEDCNNDTVPDECQLDSDQDGIIDDCDQCQGDDTLLSMPCDNPLDIDDCVSGFYDCLEGSVVCTDDPLPDSDDTDGDGVFDCNDQCNDTPAGAEVMPDGCRPIGGCCFDVGFCWDDVAGDVCGQISGYFLGHQTACDADPDGDGSTGCDDGCPQDSAKTDAGACGCGEPDTDSDGDLTADCVDDCPDDPDKTEPGICGCGQPDQDSDGDQTLDCQDECPNDPGKVEPLICGCGQPDADNDEDNAIDCEEDCPDDPLKTEFGVCGCGVPDDDTDGDQVEDCIDDCRFDPDKVEPGICGCGAPDVDSDGDEALDCEDECPDDPDKVTAGICGCGLADVDTDEDSIPDCRDNCPDSTGDDPVDENGCPRVGACCFSRGVCVPLRPEAECEIVGGSYRGNGSECDSDCPYFGTGDYDDNGNVTLLDFGFWATCFTGPGGQITGPCAEFDFDGNEAVDLADFRLFQQVAVPE